MCASKLARLRQYTVHERASPRPGLEKPQKQRNTGGYSGKRGMGTRSVTCCSCGVFSCRIFVPNRCLEQRFLSARGRCLSSAMWASRVTICRKRQFVLSYMVCTKHTHAQTHIGFLSRGSSNESAFLSARHLAIHYLNFPSKISVYRSTCMILYGLKRVFMGQLLEKQSFERDP